MKDSIKIDVLIIEIRIFSFNKHYIVIYIPERIFSSMVYPVTMTVFISIHANKNLKIILF